MYFVQLYEMHIYIYIYVNELDIWTGTLSLHKGFFIYYEVDELPCFKKKNKS